MAEELKENIRLAKGRAQSFVSEVTKASIIQPQASVGTTQGELGQHALEALFVLRGQGPHSHGLERLIIVPDSSV